MRQRSWKQIEDSRDRRLWLTQVGLPLAGGVLFWMSDEDRREWTVEKIRDAKAWVDGKVNKLINR